MRVVQQQLNELLASYQASEPEVRANMDAALAISVKQALQQTYYSLSTTERANLDAESRRLSGYTFTGLLEGASTVPGLVKTVNILISSLENLAGVPPSTIPTYTTATKTQPATSTTKTATPTKTTYNGDAIDIGSGQLKLGWVLYGRTDLSEEAAQAIYDGKVKERQAALDKTLAAQNEKLQKDKLKLEMFEKGLKDKNLQSINSALQSDLTEAKAERTQAASELGKLFLKEALSKSSTSLEKVFTLNDVGTGAYDMQSLTMKTERTRSDWEAAGKGLAGILTAVAGEAGYKAVGPWATGTELLADCIYLHLADARVNGLENSINQTNTMLENNRDRLQQQIQMDNERLEAIRREKNTLTNTSYLDLRY